MNYTILAVGNSKKTLLRPLIEHFIKLIPRLKTIIEINSKIKDWNLRKKDENNQIFNWIKKNASVETKLIFLDKSGMKISSKEFSTLLSNWRDYSISNCIFVIGGSSGLDNKLFKMSDTVISFGNNTWPHMLFRVMLLEQLYRADCITKKHPYHRS